MSQRLFGIFYLPIFLFAIINYMNSDVKKNDELLDKATDLFAEILFEQIINKNTNKTKNEESVLQDE
ncbi:MAG: hypothetical protein WCT33_03895 [Patescibacteria group bacterium]|jgi:hypothetical protein